MRHIYRGQPVVLVVATDFMSHIGSDDRVEVAQGLVHEKDPWCCHHGPTHGDALLLSTGQRVGFPPKEILVDQ